MTILSLKKVVYTNKRTNTHILNEVTADFSPGKIYGIFGKSGSGKTILLALLAGLDKVNSGNIFFEGQDLAKINCDVYRRKNVGSIFQQPNLLVENTVLASMQLHLENPERNKSFYYDYLRKFDLDEKIAHQKIKNLPLAVQQKLCLANAIIHHPTVVFIDEPTEVFSQLSLKKVLNFLRIYAKNENKCIIISTQNKEVADNVDELWGLNGGKLSFIKDNDHAYSLDY